MADRLILVRHAKPLIEPGTPSAQWALSEEGQQAAVRLARRLALQPLPLIVSSPEPKARATAVAFSPHLVIDADFAEHHRPEAGLLDREDFLVRIAALFARPGEVVLGSESADAAHARFAAAIGRHRQPGHDLVVVSHSTVITLYLSRLLDFEPMPFWQSLAMPMAVIVTGSDMQLISTEP